MELARRMRGACLSRPGTEYDMNTWIDTWYTNGDVSEDEALRKMCRAEDHYYREVCEALLSDEVDALVIGTMDRIVYEQ